MFDSSVLEMAAGLIFTFLAVSLATSSIVEAIASMTKWRSRTLLSGVKDLVNDPGFKELARNLYEHALVNPRGSGVKDPTKNMPAYIDSKRFAAALLDITKLTAGLTTAGTALATLHSSVDASVPPDTNPQVNALLHGAIQRGQGSFDAVKADIAAWFDTGMDRLSGAYKRWSQLVSLCIALILCVLLNIDAVCIARTLWATPGIAAKVQATQNASSSMDQLLGTFPVGWPNGLFNSAQAQQDVSVAQDFVPGAIHGNYAQAIVGWLITALATLFGAPFWFDALQTVIRLKGAGPSPNEKTDNKAAAA